MAESIALERRTRSQLTLPDNILTLPQLSPFKHARTAARHNHATLDLSTSQDASDDDLLISPIRKAPEREGASKSSKREASPAQQDDYIPGPGSPSTIREAKRAKRDPDFALILDSEDRGNLRQTLLSKNPRPGHSRNYSDSDITHSIQRSAKRRAAKSKQNLNASPPPHHSSSSPPTKGRAHSVPLFPTLHEIPHIDFRNPPPSPKRSRSRSPSKDFPKFQFTLGSRSDLAAMADETPLQINSSDKGRVSSSTSQHEPSPSVLPSTPFVNRQSILPLIPFTPATTRSLNELIPMSPLTPVPETPFPVRTISTVQDRLTSKIGWGMPTLQEDEAVTQEQPKPPLIAPSTSNSRLPRPSINPSNDKAGKTQPMGPPPLPGRTNIKVTGTIKAKGMGSFFDAMMPKRLKPQISNAVAKNTTNSKPGPSMIESSNLKRNAPPAIRSMGKPKPKAKQKMKPREKQPMAPPPLVPDLDGDETFSMDSEPVVRDNPECIYEVQDVAPQVVTLPENVPTGDNDVVMSGIEESPSELVHTEDGFSDKGTLQDTSQESVPIPSQVALTDEQSTNANSEKEDDVAVPAAESFVLESRPLNEPTPNEGQPEQKDHANSTPTKNKQPFGKKRLPSTAAPADRVTRSVSLKSKGKEPEKASTFARRVASTSIPLAVKRTASGSVKKGHAPVSSPQEGVEDRSVPQPDSPMKISSPAKIGESSRPARVGTGTLFASKTPSKSKIPVKPHSTPSPTKIARAISTFSSRSSALAHSFSVESLPQESSSTLSTLSTALEKLRMPAPSRPSTSLGFNPEEPEGLGERSSLFSKDDADIIHSSPGKGKASGAIKRSVTLGASSFQKPTIASSSKCLGTGPVQKPLAAFMGYNGTGFKVGPPGGSKQSTAVGRSIFGVGGGPRRTVSKRTSLPMVVGSPIKGGGDDTLREEDGDVSQDVVAEKGDQDEDIFMVPTQDDVLVIGELTGPDNHKGKEREKPAEPRESQTSRRVSVLSHALSQSLNAIPALIVNKGAMGPPATPPSKHTGGSVRSDDSPSQAGSSQATRASARLAKTAPAATSKIRGGTDGHVSSKRKGLAEPEPTPNSVPDKPKILKDCKIFVDIRSEVGEEAGTLFSQILEGLGAKVMTRVGSTCTHIVYKNGLASTLSRYRLLRDPKPHVVGIGWVVECAEKLKRAEESNFQVDLEHTNVAGVHKRRRSMLPKLFSGDIGSPPDTAQQDATGGDGDISMDGSNSPIAIDDSLPPLERARRRKMVSDP